MTFIFQALLQLGLRADALGSDQNCRGWHTCHPSRRCFQLLQETLAPHSFLPHQRLSPPTCQFPRPLLSTTRAKDVATGVTVPKSQPRVNIIDHFQGLPAPKHCDHI